MIATGSGACGSSARTGGEPDDADPRAAAAPPWCCWPAPLRSAAACAAPHGSTVSPTPSSNNLNAKSGGGPSNAIIRTPTPSPHAGPWLTISGNIPGYGTLAPDQQETTPANSHHFGSAPWSFTSLRSINETPCVNSGYSNECVEASWTGTCVDDYDAGSSIRPGYNCNLGIIVEAINAPTNYTAVAFNYEVQATSNASNIQTITLERGRVCPDPSSVADFGRHLGDRLRPNHSPNSSSAVAGALPLDRSAVASERAATLDERR